MEQEKQNAIRAAGSNPLNLFAPFAFYCVPMLVVSPEQQLPVSEARAGEPRAWEILLARYRLPLYAYVFELVRQEQTSLDIVQEAFINAAQHINGLREDDLDRHRSGEPELGRISPKTLAAFARASLALPDRRQSPGIRLSCLARQFWTESLWPWRRAWLGMSAIWLFILTVNAVSTNAPQMAGSKIPGPNPEALSVLREQKQMLTQLLEPAAPPHPADLKTPGPRSEQRPAIAFT